MATVYANCVFLSHLVGDKPYFAYDAYYVYYLKFMSDYSLDNFFKTCNILYMKYMKLSFQPRISQFDADTFLYDVPPCTHI